MTAAAAVTGRSRALRAGLLLAGFAAAVGLRVAVGGPGAAQSPVAGLLFAACLVALALAGGVRVTATPRDLRIGLTGALLICAPSLAARLLHPLPLQLAAGFGAWALVVSVVAGAEELFLRGTLYDALAAVGGPWLAVAGAAVAFALLHLPLYGVHVLPLDLAVGLVLGLVRHRAGSPTAPGVAHIGADLVSWFLR